MAAHSNPVALRHADRSLSPSPAPTRRAGDATIHDLATHPLPFVSVHQLADYWLVSRRYLYKQIESGTLCAIKIGPRSYRIPSSAALTFELSRTERRD